MVTQRSSGLCGLVRCARVVPTGPDNLLESEYITNALDLSKIEFAVSTTPSLVLTSATKTPSKFSSSDTPNTGSQDNILSSMAIPFAEFPRDVRDAIYANLVSVPDGVRLTRLGGPIAVLSNAIRCRDDPVRLKKVAITAVHYFLFNKMFHPEIKAAWLRNNFVVEATAVQVSLSRPLRCPIMQDVYKITLETKVFPSHTFVNAAEKLTQLIAGGVVRVLKLRITAADNMGAKFVNLPHGDQMRQFLCACIASRTEVDPGTGIYEFWSSTAGQSMLTLLGHSNLSQSMLEVASAGHWVVFCPYHQPMVCEAHPTHWAGRNMKEAHDTTAEFINVPIHGYYGLLDRLVNIKERDSKAATLVVRKVSVANHVEDDEEESVQDEESVDEEGTADEEEGTVEEEPDQVFSEDDETSNGWGVNSGW